MRSFITLLLLGLAANVHAQILNAESLRKVTDTSGWSGSVSATFALKRNVNDFVTLGSDIHVQYKMGKHLVLVKNDIQFQKIEGERFENSGILHVRHNYKIRPRLAWEIFVQGQYNKVAKIDFRGLVGTGPRFKLTTSEKYKFYLGTLIMYEQEELADGITPINRDFRGSAYLSFSLYPTDNITIVSTTYFQPLISDFSDFRISSQTSAAIGLIKNLALTLNHTFWFDEFPAVGIPDSQYSFTTGIAYTFD